MGLGSDTLFETGISKSAPVTVTVSDSSALKFPKKIQKMSENNAQNFGSCSSMSQPTLYAREHREDLDKESSDSSKFRFDTLLRTVPEWMSVAEGGELDTVPEWEISSTPQQCNCYGWDFADILVGGDPLQAECLFDAKTCKTWLFASTKNNFEVFKRCVY